MTKSFSTKRSLVTSVIALMLCFSMLLGTTFAWFTDSVTSANNIIKSGNLDIQLSYKNDEVTTWAEVKDDTNVFKKETLWEPGHVEVVKLKITNAGTLALKYQLGVNVAKEVTSINVNDDKLQLSEHIKYGFIDGEFTGNRESAITEVEAKNPTPLSVAYASDVIELPAQTNNEKIVTLVVYMPETVGNEANYKLGEEIPTIELGINLSATQLNSEADSFGSDYDKDTLIKGQKITGGTYTENPALYDETLAETDSEYIAIDFVKDGKQQWVVSKRSETVVVSAGNINTRAARNYEVKDASGGNLWKIIKGLENNEHSTVYLLPGTYNEATTIYVTSSMDIIGLGNAGDVKVVKQSSSDSNRHLFNVSGTKADYIEVTLRNMYLDATAKTSGGKDNAAVQSIRKSKVKCYDLTIVKGTGWDAVAFYVNGNNAVDGVKYPAYLYVENCALNTTRSFGVVTTNGSYKFYHNNLTYGGKMYTNNSGSIKNQPMAEDVWEW